MGFLGSMGRALGAPLRALPGGKTLAKPLNKSPLGRRINNKLGMNKPASPIAPSPGVMQGAMSQAAPQSPMQMKAPPPMEAPEAVPGVQESIQAASPMMPGQGQEMPQVMPQMPSNLQEMLARNGGGFTGGMRNKQIQPMDPNAPPAQYGGIGPRWKMY